MILVLILLASCASIPGTIEPTVEVVSTSTVSITLTSTPTTETSTPQSVFRVDEFAEDYYAIVQVETDEEVFKKGWVAIYDNKSNKELIKVLSDQLYFDPHEGKLKANVLELPYDKQSLIVYDDFNFDKVKDFAIQDGQNSCYGGSSFKIYLSQNGDFIFNPDFTRLAQEYCGMFQVNEKEQKISTITKSGCCWHQYSEFVVEGNVPRAQKVVETEWSPPYENSTIKEWIDGKMTTTKETRLSEENIKDDAVISFDLINDRGKVFLFRLYGETLTYALTTKDGVVEFNFPAEQQAGKGNRFSYVKESSRITLHFTLKNVAYTIYEDVNGEDIEKIGVQVTTEEETLLLEGDIATLEGDLMNVEKTKWNNVVFAE